MIFLTVGTLYPFDRLIDVVDQAVEKGYVGDKIFAQIGNTVNKPRNFPYVASLELDTYERYFSEASAIISHAGMGTITMALRHQKPLLVMPREKKYGEIINDHQIYTAEAFAKKGHVQVARNPADFEEKIVKLKSFVPTERRCNTEAIVSFIKQYLWNVEKYKCKKAI
jgi:UDP-N-acetylglucosamine transferase subunit ALG13